MLVPVLLLPLTIAAVRPQGVCCAACRLECVCGVELSHHLHWRPPGLVSLQPHDQVSNAQCMSVLCHLRKMPAAVMLCGLMHCRTAHTTYNVPNILLQQRHAEVDTGCVSLCVRVCCQSMQRLYVVCDFSTRVTSLTVFCRPICLPVLRACVCCHRGAVGSEWGVQLLVMWPLAYICFCTYFALFRWADRQGRDCP